MRCRHYSCQCDAAHKLTLQGMTERAIEIHRGNALVRCVLDRLMAESRAEVKASVDGNTAGAQS